MNFKNDLDIQNILFEIFKRKFQLEKEASIKADINNVDTWDSLSHMELIMELLENFGLENITPDDFANLTSFSSILNYIKNEYK